MPPINDTPQFKKSSPPRPPDNSLALRTAAIQGQRSPVAAILRPVRQRLTGVTGVNWSAASEAHPSKEGGKGGVMFVTVGGRKLILKATDSPAATLFGEKILNEVGGAVTTESKLIKTESEEGKAVLQILKKFKEKEDDSELQDVWTRNFPYFENSKYIALQQNMVTAGGKRMDQIVHSAALVNMLLEPALLFNLGRALAADTLIGNADRFEGMNTENAFVLPHQQIGAIDTAAILQNYEAAKATDKESVFYIGKGASPLEKWISFLTKDGIALGEGEEPASRIERVVGTFDEWFEHGFKNPLIFKLKTHDLSLSEDQWATVKWLIKKGLDQGLTIAEDKLTGANYRALKEDFEAFETRYGKHVDYDWRAFKARRAYLLSLRQGQSTDQARLNAVEVARYMHEWKPQVRALTSAAGLEGLYPPARPTELSGTEKLTRFVSSGGGLFRSAQEKSAKELKEKVRKGEALTDQQRKLPFSSSERRGAKLVFELIYDALLNSMAERAQGLTDLTSEEARMQQAAGGSGPAAELARKKLVFIDSRVNGPGMKALLESYESLYFQWVEALNEIRDAKEYDKKILELNRAYQRLRKAWKDATG